MISIQQDTMFLAKMLSPIAQFVWETRYRLQQAGAKERSIEDSWTRVAHAAAAVEQDSSQWSDAFRNILRDFRFLPGGRILAGAGTHRAVTLCNCFVMGPIEDSIAGIFEALKEGALTLQQGGGVGYDFSTLRPRGIQAHATGMIASGPVSFMRIWNSMSETMTSTGSRRGAMMATLRCDHPDIEDFIDVKRDRQALEHFNLSVQITHAFMRAVRAGEDWPLVFPEHSLKLEADAGIQRIDREWSASNGPVACRVIRTVPARALWDRLCDSAHACGEPGVLFVDRINEQNNLGYRETLSATNPCGEVPLPPYGACTLGSINLTAFIQHPFTPAAALDFKAVESTAAVAVRFLDNVVDITQFPLFRQRTEALDTRRIGLGVTGLADALAMLGLRYDSEAARRTAGEMMKTIRDAAYRASMEIAKAKGPFPAFDRERFPDRPFIRSLPQELRTAIAKHGIRNGHLLAVAPAGSISLLAGNVSSGIEPVFRLLGKRRVRQNDGTDRVFDTADHAYALWREANKEARTPDYFVEAGNITPADQLRMHSSLQRFVDAAISKTVALAPEATPSDVARLYADADALGLKGCTVYRRQSRPDIVGARETTTTDERAVGIQVR